MSKDPIREKIEEKIFQKLGNQDISPLDLKYLSEAWHNLHNADLMMEIINKPMSFEGFGGKVEEAQLSAAENLEKVGIRSPFDE